MADRCEHGVWIGDLCYACEREKNADNAARLRRQVDEAVECCIIKDNRNLRLEIDLANVSGMLVEAWTLMVDGKVADDFGDRLQQWIDSRQPSEKRVTTRPTDSTPTGAGGNAKAFVCCEGIGAHADGCAAVSAPAVTEIPCCVHCASERISQLTFDVWECEDCGREFTFDWKPASAEEGTKP